MQRLREELATLFNCYLISIADMGASLVWGWLPEGARMQVIAQQMDFMLGDLMPGGAMGGQATYSLDNVEAAEELAIGALAAAQPAQL